MEVMEEEELANMRAHQEHFEQIRNAELAETQRLEEAEKRRFEEKERRVAQVQPPPLTPSLPRPPSCCSPSPSPTPPPLPRSAPRAHARFAAPPAPPAHRRAPSSSLPPPQEQERVQREQQVTEKVAARTFAKGFLSELHSSVVENLKDAGFFFDPLEAEVTNHFLPWLMESVDTSLEQVRTARALADELIEAAAMRTELMKAEAVKLRGAVDEAKAKAKAEEEAAAAAEAAAAEAAAAAAAEAPAEGEEPAAEE